MSPTMTTIILILASPVCAEVIDPPTETVNYCMPKSETDLSLEGFQLQLPIQSAKGINRFGAPNVETILSNGPTANRVDIVFIGDGFTETDLSTWPAVAVAGYERLFQYEPFIRYREYFNVHRVDVVSAESGVDNDPTEGVERDNKGSWLSRKTVAWKRMTATTENMARTHALCRDVVCVCAHLRVV